MSRYLGPTIKLLCAAMVSATSTMPCPAESIQILLQDGRSLAGQPDARTDQTQLWLRSEVSGVQLRSGFRWDQIAAVFSGKSSFTPTEYRRIVSRAVTPSTGYLDLPRYAGAGQLPQNIGCVAPCAAAANTKPMDARVRSLRIECYPANWNASPENDGIRIAIVPLSAQGELVPVDGQLDVELYGELAPARGDSSIAHPEFRELGRWRPLVRREHFANGPAEYELPFREWHPDFDLVIANEGVVHARLGVPTQGAFEASNGHVPLRELSFARDQLQLYTHGQYLPGEHALRYGR